MTNFAAYFIVLVTLFNINNSLENDIRKLATFSESPYINNPQNKEILDHTFELMLRLSLAQQLFDFQQRILILSKYVDLNLEFKQWDEIKKMKIMEKTMEQLVKIKVYFLNVLETNTILQNHDEFTKHILTEHVNVNKFLFFYFHQFKNILYLVQNQEEFYAKMKHYANNDYSDITSLYFYLFDGLKIHAEKFNKLVFSHILFEYLQRELPYLSYLQQNF